MWGTSSRGGKQRKNSTWSLDRIAGEILKAAEWYLDPVVCTKEMLLKNAAIIGQCLLTIGFEVPEIGFFAARDQFCDVLHCSVCPKPKRLVALRFLEVCESQAVTNHELQHRELRKDGTPLGLNGALGSFGEFIGKIYRFLAHLDGVGFMG